MRISFMWLAVLSSLATLSLEGVASAQDLATHSLSDFDRSASAPQAYAAPERVHFVDPPAPKEFKAYERMHASWSCQVADADGFAFCSEKFIAPSGQITVYSATKRFYDLSGHRLAGPPAAYAKYDPTLAHTGTAHLERASVVDGAHEKVSGGLEHDPTREVIVTKSADGRRVYAASYEKKPSLLSQVFALGALTLAEGFSERLAYGDRGYYGGYTPRSYNYVPDNCGYPPGYTGPMYPLNCR